MNSGVIYNCDFYNGFIGKNCTLVNVNMKNIDNIKKYENLKKYVEKNSIQNIKELINKLYGGNK